MEMISTLMSGVASHWRSWLKPLFDRAMFSEIPNGSGYCFWFTPHHLMQNRSNRGMDLCTSQMLRLPSPCLIAQWLFGEQQVDEYLASLQADQEKVLKAKDKPTNALEEERRKEEDLCRKLEEKEIDILLAWVWQQVIGLLSTMMCLLTVWPNMFIHTSSWFWKLEELWKHQELNFFLLVYP